jgi:glycerol-3-phosphate dehydrogenase (NAD(P)+)
LAKKGHEVRLWGHNPEHVICLKKDRENQKYLPGFSFPDSITPTADIAAAVDGVDSICMVVPSHGFRHVFKQVVATMGSTCSVVSATKGVENSSLMTMTQVISDVAGRAHLESKIQVAVLSGPSFAKEVAQEVPTAVTIGSTSVATAGWLQQVFNSPYLRVYTSADVLGLEISASLKNIVAIAAGICDGLQFGTNARAALITRGLAEMTRLGCSLGAEKQTFYGLSGLGDLVLTCTGDLSRNRSVGIKLGEGKKLGEILKEMSMVAEGVKTTKSVYGLARKIGIEMPILEQVYDILYKDKDCKTAVSELLSREPKDE